MRIGQVSCSSCGWSTTVGEEVGDVRDDPDAIARFVKAHLEGCPTRTFGHPMFGYEPRWSTEVAYLPDIAQVLVIAWTNARWGFPLHLDAVDG